MKIGRKIGFLLIAGLMLFGSIGPVSAAEISNAFLGAAVTTNIAAIHESIAQDKLVDGNNSADASRYSSQSGATGSLAVTFELDGFYDINEIRIYERVLRDRAYQVKNVKIEVGIYNQWGSLWTTVLENGTLTQQTVTGEVAGVRTDFTFPAATGDTVRITFSLANGGSTQYEFWEMEGYGVANTEAEGAQLENISLSSIFESNIEVQNEQLGIDRLNDGILDTSNNWYATSAGQSSQPLVLTVNLGSVYKIAYVGMIERWITRACSDITDIDVGLTTGETVLWKRAVSDKPLNEGSRDGDLVSSDFMLGGLCGDKLRITFDRSDQQYQQYQLVELIILGTAAESIDYEIDEIAVTRGNTELDALTAGEAAIEVRFPYVTNEDGTGQDVLLVCGVYDETTNALRFCYVKTAVLGQDAMLSIPCTIGSDWSHCNVKAFLCKSVSSLAAVSAVAEWR